MQQPETNDIKRQGIFFLIVGASSAFIEFALFQFFYTVAHIDIAVSNVAAIAIATLFNFLMNRNVTFKSTSSPLRSLVLYLLLFTFNTFLSTTVIGALVSIGWDSAFAKILTQGCIAIWNFVLYRTVIFK